VPLTAGENIGDNKEGDWFPLEAPYHVASVYLVKELGNARLRFRKQLTMIASAIALEQFMVTIRVLGRMCMTHFAREYLSLRRIPMRWTEMGSLRAYSIGKGFFKENNSYMAVSAVSVMKAHVYTRAMWMVESTKRIIMQAT
jgi:hypothetical protein